ncbi:hypothetical protein TSUD_132960 [Trifolium subterraneum]|uniref:Uncharacterized protein n=1 Tax=Trifolium subterraneum TaxID=3900 RepID=A0A2Z6LTJ5_TRISU|nr:hypothetical protein TSUD_132960 [Trifolium subterraneum]
MVGVCLRQIWGGSHSISLWFTFFGCLQQRWKLLFLSCYVFLNGGGGMPADPAAVMMVGSLVLDFGLVCCSGDDFGVC